MNPDQLEAISNAIEASTAFPKAVTGKDVLNLFVSIGDMISPSIHGPVSNALGSWFDALPDAAGEPEEIVWTELERSSTELKEKISALLAKELDKSERARMIANPPPGQWMSQEHKANAHGSLRRAQAAARAYQAVLTLINEQEAAAEERAGK